MDVKPGYKKTEVGVIPVDWEVRKLGELGIWKGGGTPSMNKPSYWTKGIHPWVSSGDIKSVLICDAPRKITDSALRESASTLLPVGSIIFVMRSGILRKYFPVAQNTRPVAINQDIKALLPNADIVSDYVLQMMLCKGPDVLSSCMKAGTTVESIEFSWLKNFSIPYAPHSAEQTAIATALSDVDALIESLEQLIKKKSQIKQGAMQELLTGKRRLPGFGNGKNACKKTEVGVIPEDWDCKTVGEIALVIRGASPRPKGDKRFYGGNIPRLMVEDVTRDGKWVTPSVDFLTTEGAKRSRPCEAGTLTIVCSGTVGIPSFLTVDACIHDGFLGLLNISSSVSANYLYSQFCMLREFFENSATHGGIFTNLTTSGVKGILVPIPPLPEQTAIATALSDMDTEIEALETKLSKTHQLKQGMMQELLTGRIRLV